MKKRTINKFTEGLVTDLNQLTAPPSVLTKAKNVDFVTTGENQMILQKRQGNEEIEFEEIPVTLSEGFRPLAAKEFNDVVYIISANQSTGEGEIGTYPSPDWSKLKYEEGVEYNIDPVITSSYDSGAIQTGFSHVVNPTPQLIEDPIPLYDRVYKHFDITNTGEYTDEYILYTDDDRMIIEGTTFIILSPNQSHYVTVRLDTSQQYAAEEMRLIVESQLSNNNNEAYGVIEEFRVEEVNPDVPVEEFQFDITYSDCNCYGNDGQRYDVPGKIVINVTANSGYFGDDRGRYMYLKAVPYTLSPIKGDLYCPLTIVEEETTAYVDEWDNSWGGIVLRGSGTVTCTIDMSNAPDVVGTGETERFGKWELISNTNGAQTGDLVTHINDIIHPCSCEKPLYDIVMVNHYPETYWVYTWEEIL